MSFQQIPVIDLNRALDPATKPQFLEELRHALIDVGFLLLTNYQIYGPDEKDFKAIKEQAVEFFNLPDHVKRECEMINSPHFLGYTKLANEITAKHTDWREQIDLGTELPPPRPDEPIYKNIEGPNLWPDENYIPQFKSTILNYHDKMFALSKEFRKLVCESIGLQPDALDRYFKPIQQCKMKLIAYPDSSQLTNEKSEHNEDTPSTGQGCGPHRDSDFLTYIYQATNHTDSLQVQNFQGKWITVPYVEDALVVNAGQTLEALTQGVCKATIHRVLVPKAGSGTRLSIPFFLTIDLDSYKTAVDIPPEILKLKEERDKKIKDWAVDVGFQFTPDPSKNPVGFAVFRNRIKSHQDVAAKWYPNILKEVLAEY
ncbi:uncharacterized protein PRCAT00004744001 [Priceomyces carsonii]|uniref:uncharacterized protein n=1 Tax=Priceomyces carsonii TaxID=28549 RepID=UPI002ED8B6CB|nr:unnamed protein product [Priceomyces carsonii]